MKLKQLASIALISIPLYFFATNTAKADEFKINLKDPTVKVDKGEEKKESNVINDFLFNDFDMKYLGEFEKRVYGRVEGKIKEMTWDFTISQELADFIQDPEGAMRGMNDQKKYGYIERISDEVKDIISREARKQAQDEFKDSEFYNRLKETIEFYEEKITDSVLRRKVEEKKAYLNEEGGINFEYKRVKYKKITEPATLVIEEKHIEKQDEETSTFRFKRKRIGLLLEHDSFTFRIKTKPFQIHSWDYEPSIELYLITKYGTAKLKAEYHLRDEKAKGYLWVTLPEGFTFSIANNYNVDKNTNSISAILQKNIKGWTVSLTGTETRYENPDETRDRAQSIWLRFEKTW